MDEDKDKGKDKDILTKLNEKNLSFNKELKSGLKKEIVPIDNDIEKYLGKIAKLARKVFDENIFPSYVYEEWEKVKEQFITDEEKTRFAYGYNFDSIIDINKKRIFKKKETAIRKTIRELFKKRNKKLVQIGKEFHCVIKEKGGKTLYSPYCPVMMPNPDFDINNPYFQVTAFSSANIKSYISEKFFRNNLLDVQIDITYDKGKIMDELDRIVTLAQKKIGKYPKKGKRKSLKTSLVQELIENVFMRNYKPGAISSGKAMEKTSNVLKELGINLDVDSIRRKYIKSIKDKYKVKTVKGLYEKWHK